MTLASVTGAGTSAGAAEPRRATPAAAFSAPPAPTATSAAAPSTVRRVTLPTGDVVTVSVGPNGRQTASVAARHDGEGRDVFQTFNLGGDLYVVPETSVATAAQDLAAFDVSRLAGLGTRPVQPNFPMKTLTLTAIAPNGRPDNGDSVVIYNVDNMEKYAGYALFTHGIAKVSVPTGHYTAFGFFYNFRQNIARAVMLAQFTVTGDTSVTVDARLATSRVSVHTPQPADPQTMSVEMARSDPLGHVGSYVFLAGGATQFYAQPVTRTPQVGRLYYFVYSRLSSPAGVTPAYTYDVKFPSEGMIPVGQDFVAAERTLAAVASTYTATHRDTPALDTRFGLLPWEQFAFAEDLEFTEPTYRVEYYSAGPELSWQAMLFSVFEPADNYLLGGYQSTWRTYDYGSRLSTTWGGGQPIHPVLEQGDIYPGLGICPACLSGDTLDLLAYPFGDQDPQHFGFPDYGVRSLHESISYAVSADGKPIQASSTMLDAEVTLPPSYSLLRVDYDTYRSSPDFTLSTSVHTTWTMPRKASRGTLPDNWLCTWRSASRACGVLPLMTNTYDLPVDALGRLPSGTAHGTFDIAHLAGSTGVAVTSLTAAVSFDGGTTWQPAKVAGEGSGRFAVSFTVPAAGHTNGYGALRIAAKDALGGTLDQTVQRAFAVAAS